MRAGAVARGVARRRACRGGGRSGRAGDRLVAGGARADRDRHPAARFVARGPGPPGRLAADRDQRCRRRPGVVDLGGRGAAAHHRCGGRSSWRPSSGGCAWASPGSPGRAWAPAVQRPLLVALSQRTLTTTNEAGTVDVTEGLTWWWTGGLRPGTVTGAAALAVLVGLVSTVGARWWRGGRAVAYGVVVVPGLLITLIAAAGAVWLTSSTAVGVSPGRALPTARQRSAARRGRGARRGRAHADHS